MQSLYYQHHHSVRFYTLNISIIMIYRLYILVIIIILIMPLTQQKLHIFKDTQLNENRYLKTSPHWQSLINLPQYISDYEVYLKDTFGFRDVFIRTRNQLDLSLFGVSEKVYVNSGGYLFSREFEEKYRKEMNEASPEQWKLLLQKLEYLNLYLKQQGIQMLVVPIPHADSIYPEEFSKLKYIGFSTRLYDRFFAFFDNNGIEYVNLISEFQQHKNQPLYYKTDIHYTTVGAYYAMRAILNKLYVMNKSSQRWEYPLEYTIEPFSGGVLNDYLAVFYPLADRQTTVARKWKQCAKATKAKFINTCPGYATLPTSMIFANSYMSGPLESGFSDQFTALYVNLILDTEVTMAEKIQKIPPDVKIVMIQFYEEDVWMFLYGDVFPQINSLGL